MEEEKKASGLAGDPPTEFENAMEEICEKFNAADKEQQNLSKGKKEKIEKDKEAQEMRNKALERVGETRKKQPLDGAYPDVKPGK